MYKSLFISILLLPVISLPAGAVPKEVILYRQSACVTELTKVRFQSSGKQFHNCIVIISGQADPASFLAVAIRNDRIKIEDIAWRKLPNDEEAGIKALRREAKQLKEEKNGLLADLEGIENQLQFWQQQTKAKAKTPAEAGVISANIGKNTKKAFLQKLLIAQEITRLEKRSKGIEEQLNGYDGAAQSLWQGTITFSGVALPEALLSYSYTLTGCGWCPIYRLDAVIAQDKIKFAWEAEVWQNSGQIWQDVDVRLALTPLPFSPLTPLTMPSPLLKPEDAPQPKRGKSTMKHKPPPAASGQTNDEEPPLPAAVPGDFPVQQVVKITLSSGSRQKIILKEEDWPADLDYLVRPEYDLRAYLRAHVHLSAAKEIPRGEAVFFRNGSLLRKGEFAFTGQQGTIFIGQDPLVAVARCLPPGEASAGSKQPQLCCWEAQNNHTLPIKLRIEETAPAAAGGTIKPSLSPGPVPVEEKPGLWVWTLDLPAGEKKTLLSRPELAAPAAGE